MKNQENNNRNKLQEKIKNQLNNQNNQNNQNNRNKSENKKNLDDWRNLKIAWNTQNAGGTAICGISRIFCEKHIRTIDKAFLLWYLFLNPPCLI